VSEREQQQPLEPELITPLEPEAEAELLQALEHALRPHALAPETNERLIELALTDPLAPASPSERAAAERLRDALETGATESDAELARALGAAFRSSSEASALEASERALETALPARRAARSSREPSKVVYGVFGGAGAVLALAAAVALFAGVRKAEPVAASSDALRPSETFALPRTSAALFDTPFELRATTARIDRIASARQRDLRGNRYAAWGVR
jgi:hypothetical protein